MKFLIIAPRFHTNLYYRAKALQDAGHTVKVVVLYKGKSEFYKGIDLRKIGISLFSKTIISLISFFKKEKLKSSFELRIQSPNKELKQIIKNFNPDVILLKAYQNMLAIKTLSISKLQKNKVLMLTQTNFTDIKGFKFLFRLNIKLFKFLRVHSYITPIKSNFDAFTNFGIKNIFYLPFVYPINNTIHVKEIETEIKILTIGKFQKRKDQLLLLKSFKKLLERGYNLKLCIIGELVNTKYVKVLHNFTKLNSLSESVCIKTNLSYPDIQKEYSKHDLFVLPAYNEPAAYSPVEALANGLPVICSDENGTKCYIEEGKNGYVFKAKNENDLTETLKLCISDREKLFKMKENALLLAEKHHKLEKFSSQVLKICDYLK